MRFNECFIVNGERIVCKGCGKEIKGEGMLYYRPISNWHRPICCDCKEEEEESLSHIALFRDIFQLA